MDLSLIMTPSDYQTVAASTEQLEAIEDCMSVWVKQIEQVAYPTSCMCVTSETITVFPLLHAINFQ